MHEQATHLSSELLVLLLQHLFINIISILRYRVRLRCRGSRHPSALIVRLLRPLVLVELATRPELALILLLLILLMLLPLLLLVSCHHVRRYVLVDICSWVGRWERCHRRTRCFLLDADAADDIIRTISSSSAHVPICALHLSEVNKALANFLQMHVRYGGTTTNR